MIACNIKTFLEIFLHLSTSSPFSQSIYSRRQLTTTHWVQNIFLSFLLTYLYVPTYEQLFLCIQEFFCDKSIYMYMIVPKQIDA